MYLFANEHRGYCQLQGCNLVSTTPSAVGDATRQRYTYYINNGAGLQTTALPHALSPYLGVRPLQDTTYTGVENAMAVPPILDLFLCPSDVATAQAAADNAATNNVNLGNAPRWFAETSYWLTGYSSYVYNEEVLGFQNHIGSPPHTRLRGLFSAVPHPSSTMLMCDGSFCYEAFLHKSNGYAVAVSKAPASLADFFNLGAAQQEVFDDIRHKGRMNILYVDGHVDTEQILASGASNYPLVDATAGSMYFQNSNTERPSGYSGGTVATPWSTYSSNAITGGTSSGGGLTGVGLDVDFPD